MIQVGIFTCIVWGQMWHVIRCQSQEIQLPDWQSWDSVWQRGPCFFFASEDNTTSHEQWPYHHVYLYLSQAHLWQPVNVLCSYGVYVKSHLILLGRCFSLAEYCQKHPSGCRFYPGHEVLLMMLVQRNQPREIRNISIKQQVEGTRLSKKSSRLNILEGKIVQQLELKIQKIWNKKLTQFQDMIYQNLWQKR